jgi:2-keto-4-pentenoate hydratase/2-oxohepta-3-ene-1,7-dioic acid hydratase in catechol pathway
MVRWVRFESEGAEKFGTLADDNSTIAVHSGNMLTGATPTGIAVALDQVRLLAPVRPGKFLGLWNNFKELATRNGHVFPTTPLYFIKAPTALNDPEGVIRQPSSELTRIFYEGELGIVIGKTCRNVDEAGAEAAIFGYTCVNDVTAAEAFGDDPNFSQWARAKSCDTFGPIGPAIATGFDWAAARVKTVINGRERQSYALGDMIIPPARIVSLISREMTLQAGDLIACGTSLGVLPMRPGTVVEVAIDGIGTLRNRYEGLSSEQKASA